MPEGKVIRDKLDLNEVIDELSRYSSEGAGALVIFIGIVKGMVDGEKIKELEYSIYEPYASEKLNEIAVSESEDDEIYDVRVYHRIGRFESGEPTVYIFVSAKNRDKAFKKAKKILERVKHEPYIFKLEKREDSEYWVLGDGKRVKKK